MTKSDKNWIDGYLANNSWKIVDDFLLAERKKCSEMLLVFSQYRIKGYPKSEEGKLNRVLGYLEGKISLVDSIQNLFVGAGPLDPGKGHPNVVDS